MKGQATKIFRQVWGSDASRGFKLASWGAAFAGFYVINTFMNQEPVSKIEPPVNVKKIKKKKSLEK